MVEQLFNHARIFITAILLLGSAGAFAEPTNLGLLKKETRHYHDSGQYEQELNNSIRKARCYIMDQIKYYKKNQPKARLALVLDIDETSLSNYAYINQRDFSGESTQIHQEILKANAPAIKATLALYKTALAHGVKVFFVTGRLESELAATKINLEHAGYTQWAGIYVRPTNYKSHSIIPFKSQTRSQIEKKGYIILATIGDQYSDIRGGHARKGFKLPNPFYYIS